MHRKKKNVHIWPITRFLKLNIIFSLSFSSSLSFLLFNVKNQFTDMEEENHHMRSYLGSTHSGDYVLQIDPESTSSTPPQKLLDLQTRDSDVEVCYPYQDQSSDQHSTIDVDSLNNYLKSSAEPDNNYLEKHQLTAKLDDLLDNNSSSDKIRIARKYSLYGENIQVIK